MVYWQFPVTHSHANSCSIYIRVVRWLLPGEVFEYVITFANFNHFCNLLCFYTVYFAPIQVNLECLMLID